MGPKKSLTFKELSGGTPPLPAAGKKCTHALSGEE